MIATGPGAADAPGGGAASVPTVWPCGRYTVLPSLAARIRAISAPLGLRQLTSGPCSMTVFWTDSGSLLMEAAALRSRRFSMMNRSTSLSGFPGSAETIAGGPCPVPPRLPPSARVRAA